MIFAHKEVTSAQLPRTVVAFRGQLPRRDATAQEALNSLTRSEEPWPAMIGPNNASPYSRLFKQGATIVPRRLSLVVTVEPGRFGGDRNAPLVESRTGAQDKSPWKDLPPLRGQIERKFLRPFLLGESIAPFRLLEPVTAIIPWDRAQSTLLDSKMALDAGYPQLARWLRNAEALWDKHGAGNMTLNERLDYYRNLSTQFPLKPLRVVYAKAGVRPAAAVVRDNRFVIDHMLYWMPAGGEAEARYLIAVLNSETARGRVEALQSEGQFGPRHFDKVMFSLPIPRYSATNGLHGRLALAAEEAEQLALSVALEGFRGFQAKRRAVRQALVANGVAPRIDQLVTELLGGAESARPSTVEEQEEAAGRL